MKHIILDTNVLMAAVQWKLDIFEELKRIADFKYDIKILDKTVDELKNIQSTQKGKDVRAAKLALMFIRRLPKIKTNSDKYVDDLLVDYSKKGYIVATQDLGLKRRLSKPYITIRQKKHLVLTR